MAKANAGTLGGLREAVVRIANAIMDNDWLKGYMISSMAAIMAAIVTVQGSPITDEQIGFMDAFQELFDMRPSQFQLALSKGEEWGVALLFVVNEYAKANGYVK